MTSFGKVPRDLTDATRERAEASTKKLDTRKTRGEKDNKKRTALVATVYTVAPHLRTPDQVVAGLSSARDTTRTKPKSSLPAALRHASMLCYWYQISGPETAAVREPIDRQTQLS